MFEETLTDRILSLVQVYSDIRCQNIEFDLSRDASRLLNYVECYTHHTQHLKLNLNNYVHCHHSKATKSKKIESLMFKAKGRAA